MYRTLKETRDACKLRGFKVYGHRVDGGQYYSVVNFRGGLCFGGLNARCGRRALIDWANKYMSYPLEVA